MFNWIKEWWAKKLQDADCKMEDHPFGKLVKKAFSNSRDIRDNRHRLQLQSQWLESIHHEQNRLVAQGAQILETIAELTARMDAVERELKMLSKTK